MFQKKHFIKYLTMPCVMPFVKICDRTIDCYQKTLSPDHGIFAASAGNLHCRFYPSCSEYARQALRQYGLIKGIVVSWKRIIRCHPWQRGGYDPVSDRRGSDQV